MKQKFETTIIKERVRTPANAEKIKSIKFVLDAIGDEDVDAFFIANMTLAKELQYNLADDPQQLLRKVEEAVEEKNPGS